MTGLLHVLNMTKKEEESKLVGLLDKTGYNHRVYDRQITHMLSSQQSSVFENYGIPRISSIGIVQVGDNLTKMITLYNSTNHLHIFDEGCVDNDVRDSRDALKNDIADIYVKYKNLIVCFNCNFFTKSNCDIYTIHRIMNDGSVVIEYMNNIVDKQNERKRSSSERTQLLKEIFVHRNEQIYR